MIVWLHRTPNFYANKSTCANEKMPLLHMQRKEFGCAFEEVPKIQSSVEAACRY